MLCGKKRRGRKKIKLNQVFGDIDAILIGVKSLHNAPLILTGGFILLREIHYLSFPVLSILVKEKVYLRPIDEVRLFLGLNDDAHLIGIEVDKGAQREDADHIDQDLDQDGVEILSTPLHHQPQDLLRHIGKPVVHSRSSQGIIKIRESDDPSEKSNLSLSCQFGISAQVISEMMLKGATDHPSGELSPLLHPHHHLCPNDRMSPYDLPFLCVQFSGLIQNLLGNSGFPDIVKEPCNARLGRTLHGDGH